MSDNLICFSYQFLDLKHKKFILPSKGKWFHTLFEKKKVYSKKTLRDLKEDSGYFRLHDIEPSMLKGNFRIPKDLSQHINENETPFYQLKITDGAGRLHGFFLDNIFFVIWFDENHCLYPIQERGKNHR